jgi:sulfate permease
MSPLFNHLLIPYLIAMSLAMTMGGSGTAPAFSAAYGANVIRKSLISGLFGIMVFIGALVAGKGTTTTMGQGLIQPHLLGFTVVSIILFSVFVALLIANLVGIPQSTVQATVLSIVGAAVYFHEVNNHKLFTEIIPTWFILPVISFVVCFLIGKYIYKPIRKTGITMSKKFNESPVTKALIVIMSMYVAFSIGANNVANAAGPITTMTINEMNIIESNHIVVMILAILFIAPSFGIGSSIFGTKVLKNTGKEIVLFGRFEAVIIAFVSASLLLTASVLKGIPSSLVQVNVAAIIGIGVAKLGFKNIFKKTAVNKFFFMWVISPAIAFSLSLLLVYTADRMGLIY